MVEDLLAFAAVGFAAQMIDGAIGMAYGLSATSVLLTLGVAPATASASVHAAEVFTTGASGLAHWRLGNVRRALVLRLAVPGVLGGVLGAYVLVITSVAPDVCAAAQVLELYRCRWQIELAFKRLKGLLGCNRLPVGSAPVRR